MLERIKNWFTNKSVYILLPNGQLWKSDNVPKKREAEVIEIFLLFPTNPEKGYEYIPLHDSVAETPGLDYGDYDGVHTRKINTVLFTFETQYYGGKYAQR